MVMAKYKAYRCPDCGNTFRHLHLLSDLSDYPDRCPVCKSWVSEDEPPEAIFTPQAPGIRKSAYTKAVDQTYRVMEAQSIERAEEAADMLHQAYRDEDRNNPLQGDPAVLRDLQKHQIDEVKSGLKITNMKDPSQMREGESAAISSPANPVTARAGFQQLGGPPPNYAPGVGAVNMSNMIRNFTSNHSARATGMVRAGNIGTDRG